MDAAMRQRSTVHLSAGLREWSGKRTAPRWPLLAGVPLVEHFHRLSVSDQASRIVPALLFVLSEPAPAFGRSWFAHRPTNKPPTQIPLLIITVSYLFLPFF